MFCVLSATGSKLQFEWLQYPRLVQCCSYGLLEIMCTYKYKEATLSKIDDNTSYCVYKYDNRRYHLTETSH